MHFSYVLITRFDLQPDGVEMLTAEEQNATVPKLAPWLVTFTIISLEVNTFSHSLQPSKGDQTIVFLILSKL